MIDQFRVFQQLSNEIASISYILINLKRDNPQLASQALNELRSLVDAFDNEETPPHSGKQAAGRGNTNLDTIEEQVIEFLRGQDAQSVEQIHLFLSEVLEDVPKKPSLNVKLHRMAHEGLISRPAHGKYSITRG